MEDMFGLKVFPVIAIILVVMGLVTGALFLNIQATEMDKKQAQLDDLNKKVLEQSTKLGVLSSQAKEPVNYAKIEDDATRTDPSKSDANRFTAWLLTAIGGILLISGGFFFLAFRVNQLRSQIATIKCFKSKPPSMQE